MLIFNRIYNRLLGWPGRLAFGHLGKGVSLRRPLRLRGVKYMHIGDRVVIKEHSWLEADPCTGSETCRLFIGRGVSLGHFSHIYATLRIEIGQDVLTANGVYIADNTHGYEDITCPVIDQPVRQLKPVFIGEGSWLGEHVAVIGASVGKHCVIGANSVVTRDIPDYCVAAGVPARVIRRFCPETGKWEKCEKR